MNRTANDILGALVDAIADAVAAKLAEQKPAPAASSTHQPAEWLDMTEAAAHLGFERKTLEDWRSVGSGPPAVRIGRSLRFRRSDLDAWAAAAPQIASRKRRG